MVVFLPLQDRDLHSDSPAVNRHRRGSSISPRPLISAYRPARAAVMRTALDLPPARRWCWRPSRRLLDFFDAIWSAGRDDGTKRKTPGHTRDAQPSRLQSRRAKYPIIPHCHGRLATAAIDRYVPTIQNPQIAARVVFRGFMGLDEQHRQGYSAPGYGRHPATVNGQHSAACG